MSYTARATPILHQALAHHQAGRLTEAEGLYRQALTLDRGNIDAMHLLGTLERQLGNLDEAEQLIRKVVTARPGFAEAHCNLGMVFHDQGRMTNAIACYERALKINRRLAEAQYNLGNSLRALGEDDRAAACYRQALALKPIPEALHNLGNVLTAQGRPDEAMTCFRQALQLRPEFADVLMNLGSLLQERGQLDEAIVCHNRAAQLRPDSAEAHNNLGNALKDYGRADEAIVCYRRALALKPDLIEAHNNLGNALSHFGRHAEAIACFQQALTIKPEFAEAHLNIGNIFKVQGRTDEAIRCFTQALASRPGFAEAHNNLGVICTERNRDAEAIDHLTRAIELKPGFAEAWNNLGNVYKNQGRLTEALDCFRRALAIKPDYSGSHSNILFTLNYVEGVSPADLYAEHRRFNELHAARLVANIRPHANGPDPDRRLKVGYVSPDFRSHACAFFLEPLFAHHDPQAVEVHCYAEVPAPDAVTARLRALVPHWQSTVGLRDEQVVDRMRADGIDILIDLAGHTANNRLLVFARKPAPVQVCWLGYPATTGLDTMDYRLTDNYTEPAGTCEQYYTEKLVRLPHALWCYQPHADMTEPGPLPALANGHLTFGSFNNLAKVGPAVIALWAALLRAIPDARLVIITAGAGEAQNRLLAAFASHGIGAGRLELHGRLPRAEYLAIHQRVDVALDPFPCNGGTTTCDSLWMGLPVISLIGDTFLSRAGYSLLSVAGLAEFAAASPAEYVAIGQRLARDLDGLAALRASLRARVAASPLVDARQFARDMEAAYRQMWRQWCDQCERPAGR